MFACFLRNLFVFVSFVDEAGEIKKKKEVEDETKWQSERKKGEERKKNY